MDRSASLNTLVAAGLLLIAACGKGPMPEPESGLVEVTFSVLMDGEGSRTSIDLTSDEKKIARWALLLYQDGKLVNCGTVTPSGTIRKTLATGDYEACAIVNYRDAGSDRFRPANMLDTGILSAQDIALADNAAYRFVMFGSKPVTILGNDGTQTLPVERLVCKTGIRKISLSPDAPALFRNSFVLKAIFLTNCVRSTGLFSDPGSADLPTDIAQWANPMGYSPEQDLDALLADTDIDRTINLESPYTVPHYFYCYPNPTAASEDTHSPEWARRCTRMVIQAQVGDRTCYYPITLPSMKRNTTYIADEVIIRSLGSPDPEQEIPGTVEVVFSTDLEDWSPEYTIDEES